MAIALLLALIAGLVLPIQAGLNAQLRTSLGSPALATLVSFLVGTLAIVPLVFAAGVQLPTSAALSQVPWSRWTGGALGATYVLISIIVAPRLGAATLIATVVAGQMIAAVILDHYGAVGYAQHSVNLWRVAGVFLVILGVVLIQRN